jgi:hypothetical protein
MSLSSNADTANSDPDPEPESSISDASTFKWIVTVSAVGSSGEGIDAAL